MLQSLSNLPWLLPPNESLTMIVASFLWVLQVDRIQILRNSAVDNKGNDYAYVNSDGKLIRSIFVNTIFVYM